MPRTNLSTQFDPATIKATKAKIVKRNTFERQENNETIIRLHGTDIVRKYADGRVVLNSAGWKTVTTKDRMNDHLPAGFQLYSDKGHWYVRKGSWGDKDAPAAEYFDGMSIPDDVLTPKRKSKSTATKEEALRKQIRKFVCDVPLKGPFPVPSSGDCWLCMMKTTKSGEKNRFYPLRSGHTLGDAMGDNSHILEHVKERYLHGSLIVNALEWAGYSNPQTIYHMGLGANIRRALKRYLYRQCGLVS